MKVLYCAGEQAAVVLDILRRCGTSDEIVLLDDDANRHGTALDGIEIVGGGDKLGELDPSHTAVLVTFGARQGVRVALARRVTEHGFDFFNAVDPEATVSATATIGVGVTINALTYVGPNVTVDDHVLVDSNVTVSHDCRLSEGATIAPDATLAGGVRVQQGAFVGAGATIRDHVTVGANATVGAGAVVAENVSSEETVVGVPATPLE
ncbi:acetyltransferase [Natrinema ejinorense]|uniref:Uncharacterized protein n=1 Tax=Natrinema ejinorense TaxID=373386 RepID=A0A2A5QQ77_9EURY|nr:acetyltransferase [Natrinema ejinorense]PCR89011.1 hypothetical protein CP557_21335 [Natrinema ejinorense]